jgi:hypothetical protein
MYQKPLRGGLGFKSTSTTGESGGLYRRSSMLHLSLTTNRTRNASCKAPNISNGKLLASCNPARVHASPQKFTAAREWLLPGNHSNVLQFCFWPVADGLTRTALLSPGRPVATIPTPQLTPL